jgi:plastocyanin
MKRLISPALVIAAMALAGCGSAGTSKPTNQEAVAAGHARPNGRVIHVAIKDYRYSPSPIRIAAGTTVVWTNDDDVAHTVSQRNRHWGSGDLAEGDAYKRVFTDVGRVEYLCKNHYFQSGLVIVD